MGFFRRLLGQSSSPEPPRLVDEKVFAGRGRSVQIVGESYYQDALARLAGPKTEQGVSVYKPAELVPDPSNRHDRNAVAIKIDGVLVGHLPREHALSFHAFMAEHGYAGCGLSCRRGRIHGGWKRPGGDEGHYGVTLLLPETLAKSLGVE